MSDAAVFIRTVSFRCFWCSCPNDRVSHVDSVSVGGLVQVGGRYNIPCRNCDRLNSVPVPALTPPDPAAPFWAAITAAPHEAAPRLEFSDWCDENGGGTMAAVLRWCVATGRHVAIGSEGPVWCGMPMRAWWHPTRLEWNPQDLPRELFTRLPRGTVGYHRGYKHRSGVYFNGHNIYRTVREAHEALAHAWRAATRRGWFRRAWVPDYTPVA